MSCFEKEVRVAMVQTTLDGELAWRSRGTPLHMDALEDGRTWQEILDEITPMTRLSNNSKPHIVLLPELAFHRKRLHEIDMLAELIGCIIIGGADFYVKGNFALNQVYVSIPWNWPFNSGNTRHAHYFLGKHFPSQEEEKILHAHGLAFDVCNEFYVLNIGRWGNVGLAICADFYDIERFAIYRGRVQHIFILAYNKDINSFYYLAEAISRLVFCNVIICNTGFYGGSIAFSPYADNFRRYIYKHEGAKLLTSQIVSLPVESLARAQEGNTSVTKSSFKSAPPGYRYRYPHQEVNGNVKGN